MTSSKERQAGALPWCSFPPAAGAALTWALPRPPALPGAALIPRVRRCFARALRGQPGRQLCLAAPAKAHQRHQQHTGTRWEGHCTLLQPAVPAWGSASKALGATCSLLLAGKRKWCLSPSSGRWHCSAPRHCSPSAATASSAPGTEELWGDKTRRGWSEQQEAQARGCACSV